MATISFRGSFVTFSGSSESIANSPKQQMNFPKNCSIHWKWIEARDRSAEGGPYQWREEAGARALSAWKQPRAGS